MSIDWNKVKNNAKAKDDAQYTAMVKDTETVKKASPQSGGDALSRAINTLSGTGKRMVAGHAGTAESVLTGLGKVGSWLQDKKDAKQLAQDKEYLARYEKDLAAALAAGDEKAAKLAQMRVNQAKYRIKTNGDLGDIYDKYARETVADVDAFGDKMYKGAELDFAEAKQGAGALGRFAVDAGSVLADVAVDAVGNAIVPGLGTAGRISRSFGHGANAAQDKDLGFGKQVAYGATSAALGELTNRMFSGNPILQKATGKGALDDLLLPGLDKTVKGRIVKSALGEGLEEGVERVADIGAQRVIMGDKADKTTVKDVGYDALLGAIVGGITGGVSGVKLPARKTPVAAAQDAQQKPAPNAAGARTEQAEGRVAPQQSEPAQPAQTPVAEPVAPAPAPAAPAEYEAKNLLLRDAISTARANGHPTNRQIADVASSIEAIEELGINTNGMTASQRRAAVRTAIENIVNPPDAESSTPQGVNNSGNFDTQAQAAYNEPQANNTRGGAQNGAGEELHGTVGAGVQDGEGVVGGRGDESGRDVGQGNLHSPRFVLVNPDTGATGDTVGQVEDAEAFSAALTEARDSDSAHGWAVTPKSADELTGDKLFVREDGTAGLAVTPSGDIVAVFRKHGARRGAMARLMPVAIRNGGKMLDCYGEGLVRLYETFGFKPVCRVEFNDEYANPGWDESKGRPYIYFMVASDTDADSVESNMGSYPHATKAELDALKTFGKEGYEDAEKYRESVMPQDARTETVNDVENSTPDAGNTVGAAEAGFETPNSRGHERISNLATGNMAYNEVLGEATARNRRRYNDLFRYTTRPEEQSVHSADDILFVEKDGKRMFIRDVDEDAYWDIVQELTEAHAWGGIETDTAKMIEADLRGRSVNGEVDEDEFVKWIEVMREKATETGRGVQAWAKWTRRDNDSGRMSELEAWERIQQSNLSDEEKKELFRRILEIDTEIQNAPDEADIKRIIIEIAEERGTLSGLTGKQSGFLHSLAEKSLDGMSKEQLVQFAYSASAALSTDPIRSDIGSKLKTIQILNMLSNPKTPARNLTGNTSFYTLDALSMRGAALLDMALAKVTGTRSVAMERSILSRKAREDIAKGIRLSLAEVTMDVDMGGESRYGTSSRRTFKADGNFAERVMSALERNMSYLMTTTDEAYKGAARGTASGTQALIDAGKIKTDNEGYASEQAEELALYRTFQGNGKVTTAIQTVHDVLNMFVGVGDSNKRIGGKTVHSFGLGDMVAPFTRVAGNLASVGMDYSPVNAVKGTVEILDAIRVAATKKSVDPAKQAKAVSDFARGMSGSAIAYGVMMLAKAGIIKRAEDEGDKDVASLNQSEGMTGTQVNIDAAKRWVDGGAKKNWHEEWNPGDTLIDVSSLEPINFIISLGVDLMDNGTDGVISTFGDVDTYKDSVTSALGTAGDLPILSNVGDFAKDVFVYGASPVEAGAEMLGKTAVSSATPNIVAAFAKGLDDKQRNIYSGDGVGDVLVDYIKSRIPGVRETLPTTVNTLGEEKDNPGTLAERLLNAMLNPIGVNEYTQSAVSQEMERVRGATGETGFYPTTRKPKELTYKDKDGEEHRVTLSYEEQQKFQSTCAATQMSYTESMMKSSLYKGADAAEQADLLNRCYEFAYQDAKAGILGKDAVGAWVYHAKNAKSEIGMSPTDYLYYYEKYGGNVMSGSGYETTRRMKNAGVSIDEWVRMKNAVDSDASKSVTKGEVTAYIEKHFDKSEWGKVFDAYKGNRTWKNPY